MAGLGLVLKFMEVFHAQETVVSEAGLLEGVLIELKKKFISSA